MNAKGYNRAFTDYPYARAWGKYLGWSSYQVQAEVSLARKLNMPYTTLARHYRSKRREQSKEHWLDLTDLQSRLRKHIEQIAERYK